MHLGDKWEYSGTYTMVNHYTFSREIVGDTILPNGKRYYAILDKSSLNSMTDRYWIRLDSATGSVFKRDSAGNEYQQDSLRARLGDHFTWGLPPPNAHLGTTYSAVIQDTVLGASSISRLYFGPVAYPAYALTYGFGLTSYSLDYGDGLNSDQRKLTYAKIGGIQYGKPSSVGDGQLQPLTFRLLQNYPNPFNPSTTISYSLAQRGVVTLSIVNILGETVAAWTPTRRDAGIHSIEWNPILPSGVYFVRLKAHTESDTQERYSATMKVLLLK
jgi:hypothetical protein